MGGETSVKLTLSFLLIAALFLEAQLKTAYIPPKLLTWTEARLHCQRYYTDIVNWNTYDTHALAWTVWKNGIEYVWIGVHRDLEQPSVWKGLNLKTGVGISGDDLSQMSYWADGEPSGVCAYVETTLTWRSKLCSSKNHFYCANGDTIQHHPFPLSWYEALEYCRKHASVLATITLSNNRDLSGDGWIGLYRKAGNIWSWIDDSTSTYRNWAPEEPLTQDCVILDGKTERWYSFDCHKKIDFVCFDDDLVIVNENKTWEDALKHCREMSATCFDAEENQTHCYDLLTLTDPSDYDYVTIKIHSATTDELWTGLRFLGGEWMWLNGERPGDEEMLPDCPSQWNHCGGISKYVTNRSVIGDCSERRNFICQRIK